MNTEILGKQFGKLVVKERIGTTQSYRCQCACGKEITVYSSKLTSGHIQSCGCSRHDRKEEDITGMRSGMLVVIGPTEQLRSGKPLWECRCDCGRTFLALSYSIRVQRVKSCGCTRSTSLMKDLTNQRFGRLVALERLSEKRENSYLWRCQCDCGKTMKTSANSLLSGNCKSCGCGRVDAVKATNQKTGGIGQRLRLVADTSIDRIEQKKPQRNNTSGHTGVQRRGDKWIAVITFQKKVYYLGMFSTFDAAVQVREEAEKQLFGPFLEWYYSRDRE